MDFRPEPQGLFQRVQIRKWTLLFSTLAFCLTNCGDFRAVFNGKPGQVAKKKSHKKKDPQLARKVGKSYFIWPLNGPVNSGYGMRHGRMHDGIDIDGEEGDPIAASAAGEVVYSGKLGGYGNLIVVKHNNGLFTAYAHNKKNLVDKGKRVKQGQVIGKVGSTGHATGDHLHFEIRDDAGTHDPLDFLPEHRYSANK